MKRTSNYQRHNVEREDRSDGTILLRSRHVLSDHVSRVGDWLNYWADAAPNRTLLAERSGAGWRAESYGAVLEQVRAVAASLVARGMDANTPILIMSGNSVDHGILALAAQYVGIPVAPIAEQYSLIHGAQDRLRHAIELVRPKMAYVSNAEQYAEALALNALDGIEVVASRVGSAEVTDFKKLLRGDTGADVDAAAGAVGPETVAKILLTSGSTSDPKGVIITQRMMCSNQAQLADALPVLLRRPPIMVDWLPWSHVFGGNHNFNMALANGGSLYIDDGKPVAGLFERTVENLSMVGGSIAFNVPIGFAMLLKAMEADANLRHRYFESLDLVYYAGASLPQEIWQGLERMAMKIKGEIPLMTSSWGLTEIPAALMQQEPTHRSGVVGVPVNEVTVKLIPVDGIRYEVRAKGPQLTPGYFNAPAQTRDAFDDEGFFITGDALRFVDPEDANCGMLYDGRITEDFKLLSGTWVRSAALRNELLVCLAPLAQDLIVVGQDKLEIGVLIFPDTEALASAGYSRENSEGAATCPLLLSEMTRRLTERANQISGSSNHVGRALVVSELPSMGHGEITAKGSLNSLKILERRSTLLKRLYDDEDPAVARIAGTELAAEI